MIYINDDLEAFSQARISEMIASFPDQRREAALKFRHDLGRRQCVLAYELLCEGLSAEYGITEKPVFEYGTHGKPSITDHPEIHFNMSHCKTAVACVLSCSPVGIDIESVRPAKESVVRYAMNDDEARQIFESDNPDLEFTILWTRKESVLKLIGEGINDNMKSVLSSVNMSRITVETTVCDNYVYSVSRYKE